MFVPWGAEGKVRSQCIKAWAESSLLYICGFLRWSFIFCNDGLGSGSGSRSGLCQKAWRPHPWCWGRGNRSDLETSPVTRRERLSNESVKHSGIMNYGMFRPRSHSKAGSSKWVAILLVFYFPSLLSLFANFVLLLRNWF